MAELSLDPEQNIRFLNIHNCMAEIAKENLINFFEYERKSKDFYHLFKEYFEKVFLVDVENFIIPLINKSTKPDVDVFFIKCSFYLKDSEAYKPAITIDLHNLILEKIKDYMYEEDMYHDSTEFFSAMELILFDINFMQLFDLSTLFEDIINRYQNGSLDENCNQISSNSYKLATNLSVPELVLLFKALSSITPPLINVKRKTDLYNFISQNFQTIGSENTISPNSIKNDFNKIPDSAKTSWISHFQQLKTYVRDLD